MKNPTIFYVYEHWRPDKGECFYVGKGKDNRAYTMHPRNSHHMNIQAKLARLDLVVEIKIVAHGLTQDEALRMEIDRIDLWECDGADLANMTAGGRGGATFTGCRHRPDSIEKIRSYRRTFRHTEESKRKISDSQTGKKMSPAFCEQLRSRATGNKNWLGKKHKPETIEKMRAARTAYWAAKHAVSGETK